MSEADAFLPCTRIALSRAAGGSGPRRTMGWPRCGSRFTVRFYAVDRAVGSGQAAWPAVPDGEWRDTIATLHMWTQIAGKVCLALTPRINHFWNIAFQITPRGIATPPMPYAGGAFTITFDLVGHQLAV